MADAVCCIATTVFVDVKSDLNRGLRPQTISLILTLVRRERDGKSSRKAWTMLTEWLSSQHSGFMVLDNDHKRIDMLVNESLALLERPDNALLASKRLREMLFLLEHHFGVERCLMRLSAFPQYDAHNREHNKILAEIETMLNISGFSGKCLRQVALFVKQTNTRHRESADREFEAYLQSTPEPARQTYCRKTLESAMLSAHITHR